MINAELPWLDGTQACDDPSVDPEWFFTESVEQQVAVTKICRDCPLVLDCAQYALHHNVDGVWGGMTERTLRVMRKQLNIIPKAISGDTAYVGLFNHVKRVS